MKLKGRLYENIKFLTKLLDRSDKKNPCRIVIIVK